MPRRRHRSRLATPRIATEVRRLLRLVPARKDARLTPTRQITQLSRAPMKSLADRFRRWYEYERDCNAKSLEMLASVPVERRADAQFQKAVDRMAHLVMARRRWLHRLGHFAESPGLFPQGHKLDDLPRLVAESETAWVAYLAEL